jgi:hypothetical protein
MAIYVFLCASSARDRRNFAWSSVTVRKNFIVVRADTRSLFKTSFRKLEITKRDHL